jgi:hypothetical protein
MGKTLRALVVALVAVVTVVALQTDGDGSTPKPHYVSSAKQDVYYFGLAGNSRGDASLWWIAWARFGHTRLSVRAKTAGGSFGRPRALSGVHVSANDVHAAVGEDGTQILTWTEYSRGTATQKVAVRRPNGSFAVKKLLARHTPASTIYLGEASNLAIAPDGTAILAEVGFVHKRSQVIALVRHPNGHWSKPEQVTTGRRGVRYPVVAFDGRGAATLAWERGLREYPDDGAPRVKQQIRVAVRPPGGHFGKPRPVTKPDEDARDAALAVNARGDAALMWNATHGRNLPGSRIGVALRRARGAFGAPRLITPPGDAGAPRPAIGQSGSLVAVWTGGDRVVGARGSIAEGLGPSRPLSPRGEVHPSVAADPGGDALAIWLRYPSNTSSFDNRVEARFAGAGGALGPLLRLTPGGDYDYPQALVYGDGTAVAAWTRLRRARSRIELVHLRVRP